MDRPSPAKTIKIVAIGSFVGAVLTLILSLLLLTILTFKMEMAKTIGQRKQESCGREYMEAETMRYEIHKSFPALHRFMMGGYICAILSIVFFVIGFSCKMSLNWYDTPYDWWWAPLVGGAIGLAILLSFLIPVSTTLLPTENVSKFGSSSYNEQDRRTIFGLLSGSLVLLLGLGGGYQMVVKPWEAKSLMAFFPVLIIVYMFAWAALYMNVENALNDYEKTGVNHFIEDVKTMVDAAIPPTSAGANAADAKNPVSEAIKTEVEQNAARLRKKLIVDAANVVNRNTFPYFAHRLYEDASLSALEDKMTQLKAYDEKIQLATDRFRKFVIAIVSLIVGIPVYMGFHSIYKGEYKNLFVVLMTLILIFGIFVISVYGWFMGALRL